MSSSRYTGKYTGTELLAMDLKGSDPLIKKLLFERDNIIILGKEKSSKSILALQMACALTCQEPFLGEFEVPKRCNVVYIQCEGKLANTRANFERMLRVVDCAQDSILFLYYPSIALDTAEGLSQIVNEINGWRRPDVIFIDCLYMAMQGEMESATDSKRFVGHIRELAEMYQATIPIVHHSHRAKVVNGKFIDEGDDAIFGSFVWKAYPEHILMLEKVQGNHANRKLSCSTHRTSESEIIKSIDLVLREPDPLYFDFRNDTTPAEKDVMLSMSGIPQTIKEISKKSGRHEQTVWSILNHFKSTGIVKEGTPIDSRKTYFR